jgi:cytidine deaminase
MEQKALQVSYRVYARLSELPPGDIDLLQKAFDATQLSYAPYSGFQVGAAALMSNGETVTGANQENASFPAGICAERVLLSTVSSIFPGESIDTLAISYAFRREPGNHPVAPCGICRQSLAEYEERMKSPLRLILGGMKGEIYIFQSAGMLLPFSFSGTELKPGSSGPL